jgi:NADH dehydrogenase
MDKTSMRHESVLVIGGSGFIGSHLVAQLAASGRRVIVPTRRFSRARHLQVLPTAEVVEANIFDETVLAELLGKVDAVINLVGVLHSKRGPAGSHWGPQFERAHVELPRMLVRACQAAGVHRCLHMSALGADDHAPSMYLRSKAAGEKIMLEAKGLDVTVLRPSVVFGPEDKFLNLFATLQRFMPVLALGSVDAKFQPVFVQDVARAFVMALEERGTIGKVFELVGPHVYTLRELVRLAGAYSGHPRPLIGLPALLGRLQALMLEYMPGGPLMSRDNVDSMKADNIASAQYVPLAGWHATPLEAVAPHYLGMQAG